MARFVFIHGAWHGGWCWERLTAELEARGHETRAPDLPCEEPGLTVHDYAAVIGPEPDAVVVAHSLGGLTLPFVPARVAVFLAGLVPTADASSTFLDPGFTGMVRDKLDRSYWPDERTAHEQLYPDLDDADAAWAFGRLRRQARLKSEVALPPGERASIVTLRDKAVRPKWQEEVAHGLLGVDPLELDAGHSPFLTHPVELAGLLEWIASR